MKENENITTPLITPDDQIEVSLRPKTLEEFIGQEKIKKNLAVYVKAAKKRNQSLDHVLLEGPPGLGKTTLAYILSNELGVGIKSISAPSIERTGDLAAVLTNLSLNDCLFIDEIHRLPASVEEVLYQAMEDFRIDIMIGQGPSARSIKIPLKPFTLIGATTRSGLLTSPLLARFGINFRLDFYDSSELSRIVERSANILGIDADKKSCMEIARRSRGTPRIANRLLKRIRDFAEVEGSGKIDLEITKMALNRLEVDDCGLDEKDRKFLSLIIEKFGGGPVGLDTLSVALSEDKGTIEDVYEPYLIQSGFIQRTSRGRVAAKRAYEHLGIKRKKEDELF